MKSAKKMILIPIEKYNRLLDREKLYSEEGTSSSLHPPSTHPDPSNQSDPTPSSPPSSSSAPNSTSAETKNNSNIADSQSKETLSPAPPPGKTDNSAISITSPAQSKQKEIFTPTTQRYKPRKVVRSTIRSPPPKHNLVNKRKKAISGWMSLI